MRPLVFLSLLLSLFAGYGAIFLPESSSSVAPAHPSNLDGVQLMRLDSASNVFTLPAQQDGYLIVTNMSQHGQSSSIQVSTVPNISAGKNHWTPLNALAPLTTSPQPVSAPRQIEDRIVEDNPQKERAFFLHASSLALNDPRGYQLVKANLLIEGELTRVYLDHNCEQDEQHLANAREIVRALDDRIIPAATKLSGPFADIDEDGKLAVLLTPTLERMQGGKNSLKGFVRASDFCKHYPRPFGNCADVIYINSECPPTTNYLTLLAHEYWHVLQFSHRLANPLSVKELQEDWICEGTAHLAEFRLGGDGNNLEHRITTWLDAPEQAPLVVPDYYTAGLWRHDGCRGGLFLFFRWCETQYGPTFLTNLLNASGTGTESLEEVTGESFETLHQHSLVGILRESLNQTAHSDRLKRLDEQVFNDISLSQLTLHVIEPSSPLKTELQATSSTFLKVSGETAVRIQSDEQVTLRVMFVPAEVDASQTVVNKPTSRVTR